MSKKPSKDELVFLPLGGVGEIGMNFALYGYGPKGNRRWIIVDVGVTFPGDDLPGADLILPDITFAEVRKKRIEGIIITHAHEDHYGALIALWPMLEAPVYVTPFTAAMLEAKAMSERGAPTIPLTEFRAGESFKVGPFEIEAVHVTHSIPEPVSLMIRTPLGNVVHTGDWKIDREPTLGQKTDGAHFSRLGDEGVLALICDSTNAMREGESPSEVEVSESLAQIIQDSPGRVLVTTFSSNVGRIRSIAQAAEAAGRKVMVLGRSLLRVCDVSRDLGYLDGIAPFLSEDEFQSVARKEIVVILTGSQGESRAALAKLSRDEHRNASLAPGDKVIFSSRTIPGNEREVINIHNALVEQGVDIVLDGEHALVHVSGHPRRNELREMYKWVRPTIGVPVHGEARHLMAHAGLMGEAGIEQVAPVRNGDLLRLAPGNAEIVEEVPHGRVYKDGNLVGSEDEMGIKRRRVLSWVGQVVLSLVIDKHGELLADPDIVCEGLPRTVDGDAFEDVLYDAAVGAYEGIAPKYRRDTGRIEQAVEKAVRAEARELWGKKPLVTVFVTKV